MEGAGSAASSAGAAGAAGVTGAALCISMGWPVKGLIAGCWASAVGAIKTTLGANKLARASLRNRGEGSFFILITYENSGVRDYFWR